jgi:hypothetical protein
VRPYPESGEIFDILRFCIFKIHFNIILPSTVTLSNGLSYQVQRLKFCKNLLYLVFYKPRLSQLVRIDHFLKANIFMLRVYSSRHSCYFLYVTLGPDILHALLSIILNQCPSLRVRDQVSHTYNIRKFAVVYIFFCKFFGSRWTGERVSRAQWQQAGSGLNHNSKFCWPFTNVPYFQRIFYQFVI